MKEIPKESKLNPLKRVLIGIASGVFFGTLMQGEPQSSNAFLLAASSFFPLFGSKFLRNRFEIGKTEPTGSENLKYSFNGCANYFLEGLQLVSGLMIAPAIEKWGIDVIQMGLNMID